MIQKFLERLLGGSPEWDGSDRRITLRAKCNFELEVAMPTARYLGTALDAGPKGVRLRIRGPWNARLLRAGTRVTLKHIEPMFDAQLDTVQCKISWVKKEADNLFLLAVGFDDSLENLKMSWVKPVLMKGLKSQVKQQRKQLRVRANLTTMLRVDTQEIEGRLRDLSMGGAQIETFKSLPLGTQVTVKFGPVAPHPEMVMKGTVRRCEQALGACQIGVAFFLLEGQKKQLLKFIKDFVELQNQAAL